MSVRGIGLFGGSFDPVHDAHLELARRALQQQRLEEVWFLPAWQPPHKSDRELTPAAHRLAMLELALEGRKGMALCTFEVEQEEVQYTVNTVEALAHTLPEKRFCLLLGEDSLRELPRWREPRRLLEMAPPLVMPRPVDLSRSGAFGQGGQRPDEVLGVRIAWLTGAPLDLSSTALREALARGERPSGVDRKVLDDIDAHGLYGGGCAGRASWWMVRP